MIMPDLYGIILTSWQETAMWVKAINKIRQDSRRIKDNDQKSAGYGTNWRNRILAINTSYGFLVLSN